jgi:hypothetical protein
MQPFALRLTAALALAAIWLLTHRYFGIQHDGYYYAAQALARANPEAFRHDLFFEFGSQDDYSLFSHAYAWLSGVMGLDRAAFLLLVAAHLAWALAAYALARHWLPGRSRWLGLALVFALPGHYGAQLDTASDILRYAEGFLTARSWAEALVLAGVAASLAGRRRLALAAIAGAALCHPIMALPGVIFLAAFHLRPGARHLTLLALLAAGAAWALPEMDAAWLAEVRRRARYLLLDTWAWGELGEPMAWIGILLAAATTAPAPLRHVCRSLALAGATGFYLALLATATHAAWLIQAQPWRCLWLLKIAGLLALTGMFAQRWQRSAADRWLLAGLAAAALTATTLGGPVALALAAAAHVGWRAGQAPQLPRWLPAAGGVALGVVLLEAALAILQQLAYLGQRLLEWADPRGILPQGDPAAFFQGPLALLLPLGLALLVRLSARRPRAAVFTATLSLAVAAVGWYRADDPLQTTLFAAATARPFGARIARTETVYWQNQALYTWFLLRQGNYASRLQGASSLFSRATALESVRRLDRLAAFGSTDTDLPADRKSGHRATRADLVTLCADPVLDAVILGYAVDAVAVPRWPDPLTGADWHLYRCDGVRPARG